MPDGRRPGLWKTLVAAAQTAFDRVADGLELAAEGLRSLGSDRTHAPPRDPRLAGVDPGIAAYVAAQDPEWFSFDLSADAAGPDWPSGGEMSPQWPTSEATDAARAPVGQNPQGAGHSSSATSEPPRRRQRPARGKPTAAELPAGRPMSPPRISFRRPPREAPDRYASERDASDREVGVDAGSPIPARSNPTARTRDPKVPPTATMGDVADSGPAAEVDSRPAESAHENLHASHLGRVKEDGPQPPRDHVAPRPPSSVPSSGSSPEYSSPRIAFTSRPVRDSPFTQTTAATQAPAPARQQTHEPTWPAPRLVTPAPAPNSADRVEPVTRSRTPSPASIAPTVRISRGDRATPAPWPELPPSTWSAPPADSGGTLAWAGAAPADVLIDEQRST